MIHSAHFQFLDFLLKNGIINPVDRQFANFAARLAGEQEPGVAAVIAAVTCRARTRHTKSGLSVPVSIFRSFDSLLDYLDLAKTEIPSHAVFTLDGVPDIWTSLISAGGNTPIVRTATKLALHHIYQGELRLLRFLAERMNADVPPCEVEPQDYTELPLKYHQREAVCRAVNSRFHIISGGPGTGKTTIVALLLALRQEVLDPEKKVYLCAPTGKAQARMREAIRDELKKFTGKVPEAIRERILDLPCSTVHSLLEYDIRTGAPRRNRENPLDCDLIVIDECSMISQILMTDICDALTEKTSMLLLGDKAQLSSVEPGSIFADFMEIAENFPQASSRLTESVRFAPDKGIGKLKDMLELVTPDNAQEAWDCLIAPSSRPQLLHSEPVEKEKLQEFIKGCMFSREDFGGWLTPDGTPWFKEEHLNDAWERFETLRILSPVHTGTCGVRNLNHHVCEILDFPEENISCGMVFLILKNTAQLQIFNGDTGMVWYGKSLTEPATLSEGKAEHLPLYVFFPKTDINGERVWHGVQPGLLPEHDDAYAISVHKSQGSGYNRILFFLPEMQSEHKKSLLTKELLYTGITRAKKQTELVCVESVFKETAVRETLRGNALIETFEIMQK